MSEWTTKWSGYKCTARRVLIRVGECPFPQGWFKHLVGTEMRAVEITVGHPFPEETFYIADEDGNGWRKVTAGQGSPHWGHKSVTCAEVIKERGREDLDDRDCSCGAAPPSPSHKERRDDA